MKWPHAGRAPGEPWRIEILVRRIDFAVAASILLHLLLFALPGPRPPPVPPGRPAPMQVVIANPVTVTPPEPEPPRPVERPAPQPVERVAPRIPAPRPTTPTVPTVPVPKAEDLPTPTPQPTPAPPAVDMLAMIEARRAQRRAAESARGGASSGPPAEDAASRNLRSLAGGEGVGGVFQILDKGVRTGHFAFNGWKPDARSQWREVIEVDAGLGGDIEVAMVRRMIELIRTHYSGDFKWDSHRLQRVVTLSARPEDQSGLEDFMMKEFFETPGRRARG
jgi:hypothetical protein